MQRDGICVQVIAPAPDLPGDVSAEAQRLALRLAGELGVVGVLAVELFETGDGSLLVNELAMRPHNSGHWTMDGSRTSQFEQHLRAVLDYPLGDTDALAPVTVMANVLGAATPPQMSVDERLHRLFARMPDARVHLYGKQGAPGPQGRPHQLRRPGPGPRKRGEAAGTRRPGGTLVVTRAVDGRMGSTRRRRCGAQSMRRSGANDHDHE